MVFCIQAQLGFTTAARRDTVLTALINRIVGRLRWGVDVLEVSTLRSDRASPAFPAISAQLRFSTRLDEEDLRDTIEAQATGVRTPVAGSWYSLHDCPHDEASPAPCVEASRRVW